MFDLKTPILCKQWNGKDMCFSSQGYVQITGCFWLSAFIFKLQGYAKPSEQNRPRGSPPSFACQIQHPQMSFFHGSQSTRFASENLPPDVSSKLKDALTLPSLSRQVAEWIFDERDKSFEHGGVTIPPHAFRSALALVSDTEFVPAKHSMRYRSHLSPKNGRDSLQTNTNMLSLYIPVEETEGIYLGYTFSIGPPFDTSVFPLQEVLLTTFSLSGRFAFEKVGHRMLIYITGMAENTAMLMSSIWISPNHRQRCYFALPKEEYAFDKLPSQVIGLTVNEEFIVRQPPHAPADSSAIVGYSQGLGTFSRNEKFMSDSSILSSGQISSLDSLVSGASLSSKGIWFENDVTALHPHLLQGFGSTESASSRLRTEVVDDPLLDAPTEMYARLNADDMFSSQQNSGSVVSCMSPSGDGKESVFVLNRNRIQDSESIGHSSNLNEMRFHSDSGLVDLSSLRLCLQDITASTQGTFFSPRVTRGVMDASSHGSAQTVTGKLRTRIQLADQMQRELLEQFALRSYSSKTQSVSADAHFLHGSLPVKDPGTPSRDIGVTSSGSYKHSPNLQTY